MSCGDLLIRRMEEGESAAQARARIGWFFALGCANGSAVIAWPATKTCHAAGDFYEPCVSWSCMDKTVNVLAVVDPLQWWAMPYTMVSPAAWAVRMQVAEAMPHRDPMVVDRVHLCPTAVPDTLWRTSATLGFQNLPQHVLKTMAAAFGLGPATSLLECLQLLIGKALGPTDAKLVEIIDGRIASMEESDAMSKITELEVVADNMTKDEHEEVQKCVAKVESLREEKRQLEAAYAPVRQRLTLAAGRVSTNPRNPNCPWAGKKYPDRLAGDGASWNQPYARTLLPPGAFIWEARAGRGWAGHLAPHRRVSRSWHMYGGNRGAMLSCISELWRQFLKDRRMRPDQCPMPGLLVDD